MPVHGIWNFIAIQFLKVKFDNKNYEIATQSWLLNGVGAIRSYSPHSAA